MLIFQTLISWPVREITGRDFSDLNRGFKSSGPKLRFTLYFKLNKSLACS